MKSKIGNSPALERLLAGVDHVRKADPVMRDLIDRVGPLRLKPRRRRFDMLVRSIISQQISTGAANSIYRRLKQTVAPERLNAPTLAALSLAQFRGAGISPQKTRYLVDLSEHVLKGQLQLDRLPRMTDEEVIQELVQVKGIGVWTAQMFLIFSLGRPDVFPHDDLGIRVALRKLYQLKELPDKQTSHAIALPWRPYATVASWYCWRSLENQ